MNLKHIIALKHPLGALAGILALALSIAGCATQAQSGSADGTNSAVNAPSAAAAVSVPMIAVPATAVGTWFDLGNDRLHWLGGEGPVPVSGTNAATRAVGLQREGRWLAVVVVQAAPSNGSAVCPQHDSMHVGDASPSDCLRMRRDADLDHWLQTQHSALWQWAKERGFESRPRAWVGHRVGSGGRLFEVHVLLDPALIEPVTRNNSDFLAGGQPGQQWARALASAARAAAGGAALVVPPFPFAPGVEPPPPSNPAKIVTSPSPTQATQVLPQKAPATPAKQRPDRK